MRKQDIKAGGVYAYAEARDLHYRTPWPVLILDTGKLYRTKVRQSGLEVSGQSRPRGYGDLVFASSKHGYLAVHLRFTLEDPEWEAKLAKVRAEASVAGALARGEGDLPGGLGSYKLVTSLAYLHGDYGQVFKEQAEAEAQSAAARQAKAAEDAARLARVLGLWDRLEALGVAQRPAWGVDSYDPPRKLAFTLDQVEDILGRLERLESQRFECQGCHAVLTGEAEVQHHKAIHGLVISITDRETAQ
jgi:hypothetical protein